VAELRQSRENEAVLGALDDLRKAAAGTENVLVPMKAALAAYATVGEVAGALREVWGRYQPTDVF
jgi:methylmalonyl-CoA mutase N-terminal domain/subunit